jgi:hypothetical protein
MLLGCAILDLRNWGGSDEGTNVLRVFVESLEGRLMLSAVTIHRLDASADSRFFRPIASIAAKSGAAIAAPATSASAFTLNWSALRGELNRAPREFTPAANKPLVLRLPSPGGLLQRFSVIDAPIMDDALAAARPDIRTFRGQGIDDPSATLRLDYTPLGFHVQVLSPNGAYYIDPYYRNDAGGAYVSYFKRDLPLSPNQKDYNLDLGGGPASVAADLAESSFVVGSTLRTFRLAVAADAEYTAAVSSPSAPSVSLAQAAIVTAINRVSGVYETELDIRLQLINNTSIIYTNASTDPYSNGSSDLDANTPNLNSVIGVNNYDIGHVFTTGSGGVAYLGVVGNSSFKGGGTTGLPSPLGDAFYIDYVAHEMGHQFGAHHTFNTSADRQNRTAATAYEPGSGSTIMAYAGIEGAEDLQPHSDPYFHSASMDEIAAFLATIPSVGTSAGTGNTAPSVNAGADYVIPAGTPFALTASGSDPNGDPLTYEWQERDLGARVLLTAADNGASPLFRDWVPSTSPTRLLPQLQGILDGTNQVLNASSRPVEKLFAVARTSNWRVIARDNRVGGGGVATDDMKLTVVSTGSAFSVTTGNSAVTWTGNSTQAIAWNVADTTSNGINVANVKISLSTDGGQTFPTVLAASTPNDGSESLTIPNVSTSQARIRIEAIGNIFFDLSNANVTIQQQATSAAPTGIALGVGMDTGISGSDNITRRNNGPGNALQFTVTGTVNGATVTLFKDGVNIGSATAPGTTTTITPPGAILDGAYTFTARQTEVSKSQSSATNGISVTIDTVAPAFASAGAFGFETAPQQIVYQFSEDVQASLASGDVSLMNNTTPAAPLPTRSFVYTAASNTAALQFSSTLPDGEYTAQLAAANVTDIAGNALAAPDTLNFFFLAADGTRDEKVGIEDFNTLATNFGKSGMSFTQGNYDYSSDGTVSIADFNILATAFGKTTLPAGHSAVASVGATPLSSATSSSQDDLNLLDEAGLL